MGKSEPAQSYNAIRVYKQACCGTLSCGTQLLGYISRHVVAHCHVALSVTMLLGYISRHVVAHCHVALRVIMLLRYISRNVVAHCHVVLLSTLMVLSMVLTSQEFNLIPSNSFVTAIVGINIYFLI